MQKTIGVLALQGAYTKHMEMLKSIGVNTLPVRTEKELSSLDGLVLPGGESTTISKMLIRWELIEPIRVLIAQGLPVYGTCAGLILLADHLEEGDELPRIKGLHLTVKRNAYGRQLDSFETDLNISLPDSQNLASRPFNGVFIRAPQIVEILSDDLEILCRFEEIPVLVRQKNILAGSFHPELTGDSRIHKYFSNLTK